MYINYYIILTYNCVHGISGYVCKFILYSICVTFHLLQYITLFASACPLASVVSVIFLYIELKSDLFKLLWTYKRPYPRRFV